MKSERSYDHLLSFVIEQPWAITRPMLTVIANVLGRRLGGDAEEPVAFTPTAPRPAPTTGADVVVIPMHGVIAPRMNLFSEISGGTTFEGMRHAVNQAADDPKVGTIILDIDSPGGSVAGAPEFARDVREAAKKKRVIAQAEYGMCSAAYWAGACATEIVAAPSAHVGSIGVYSMHEDLSAALEKLGVKVTFVSAGKYKIDGNPAEPLSPDARARMQTKVDYAYDLFVHDVAMGRGISVAAVRGGYGEGQVVHAAEALALGMVDSIATLEDTLARFTAASPTTTTVRATAPDTPQEPSPATGQDRALDRKRRNDTERALRELQF
jgi:signal peptide peptidase SppA